MLTIAAEETHRGWGGPIAILIAVAAFIAIATVHDHFKGAQGPSPTGRAGRGIRVNPQVEEVSDTDDTDRDTGWWGQIIDRDGRRFRQVAHVVRTGSSLPAEGVDLPLDDEGQEAETGEEETLEEYVDRLDRAGAGYAEIVREAMKEYEVSEATAKRRIREAREARNAS